MMEEIINKITIEKLRKIGLVSQSTIRNGSKLKTVVE
jgi:hypothetical protein